MVQIKARTKIVIASKGSDWQTRQSWCK